jgi:hypothetical protein
MGPSSEMRCTLAFDVTDLFQALVKSSQAVFHHPGGPGIASVIIANAIHGLYAGLSIVGRGTILTTIFTCHLVARLDRFTPY